MHYDNLNKNFHVKEDVSYVNSITDRIGYTLESSVDINKGKNHSLRIDTLESSTTQTYLTIPSKLRNTEWNGNAQLIYILNQKMTPKYLLTIPLNTKTDGNTNSPGIC